MQADKVREKFLNFFKQKDHKLESSAPLSTDDPDILFTIAGMVPFKTFFLGERKPPSSRVTSCQLCFRTNDLDRVGQTSYHHTLFEMLGNFSFGDYFKKEACEWGLELVTKEFDLSPERIWMTVFREDDETASLWKKLGIPPSRIVQKGEEENFWSMAEVGPCGPDTEIFFDRGREWGCESKDCEPGCNRCSRWVEIWNLVFMQYRRDSSGKLSPLPSKNVDTGMGLERVATVLQGVNDDYQTDLFSPIVNWIEETSPLREHNRKAVRVISDHIRGLAFLLEEGILPSNTGKGYVVRRVLRRAFRYGRKVGLEEPFLYQGVPTVARVMGKAYPQIVRKQDYIAKIIKQEEETFQSTLSRGLSILEQIIGKVKDSREKIIPGDMVFKMYDTYGFPLELTQEIASEEGLSIDEEGFQRFMEEQRRKARVRVSAGLNAEYDLSLLRNVESECPREEGGSFTGYESLENETRILAIIKKGDMGEKLTQKEEGVVVLSRTPFYPEGGGQIADRGQISTGEAVGEVFDVQKKGNLIVHRVRMRKGELGKGEKVKTSVDKEKRLSVARSHTGTHLLHAALRYVLGENVRQSGSLVEEERLRFDFTFPSALQEEDIKKICLLINQKIRDNLPVKTEMMQFEKARRKGAVALFEEKYQENVRVVKIGNFSMEVCGGTHLSATGQMGLFHIISESSVAAGVRRIEALCGKKALLYFMDKEKKLWRIAQNLSAPEDKIIDKIEEKDKEVENLKANLEAIQNSFLEKKIEEIASGAREVRGVKVCMGSFRNISSSALRTYAEKLRKRLGEAVVALSSSDKERGFLVVVSSRKDLPAGKLIKELASRAGGNGGGRWDFAQGGTSHPERIARALAQFSEIVEKEIGGK